MSVAIQILKEYSGRTEYKVLRNWLPVQENSVNGLEKGTTVVPGILLAKMTPEEFSSIASWCRDWGNQLILTPPWWETDLGSLLGLGFQVLVEEKATNFQGIPVSHILESKLNAKWKTETKETVSLDFKYDSGSGLFSVTTVPLLDYRLLQRGSPLKELFMQLVNYPQMAEKDCTMQDNLTNIHLYVLLLAAGGIDVTVRLLEKIKSYLAVSVDSMDEDEARAALVEQGYLNSDGTISAAGLSLLHEMGYKPFIREIKKRGEEHSW